MRQVAHNRALAEEQRGSHLSVRPALCDESRNAPLGRGQALLTRCGRRCFRGSDVHRSIQVSAPSCSESGERLENRIPCRTLLPCAPANDAEGEEREARP
jgi:hypothetical protein